MDKTYADTVRLLLAVAPDVFANDIFAMKGGTAINLFVRDMPRLSVDIDVVYLPWQTPRDEALQAINQELAAIATRVAPLGVQTRQVRPDQRRMTLAPVVADEQRRLVRTVRQQLGLLQRGQRGLRHLHGQGVRLEDDVAVGLRILLPELAAEEGAGEAVPAGHGEPPRR